MPLFGVKIAVAIPDTVLEERASLRDKTVKLGQIARACSIYGVDLIEVFEDPTGRGEGELIGKVLGYLETPQYLRRRLYPLDEALRFAGLLPPLRIPSHKPRVQFSTVRVGEVREGVMNADGTVDIGLDVAPRVRDRPEPGKRVTVKLSSISPPAAEVLQRQAVNEYWGYVVERKSMEEVLADARFGTRVATSRLGAPVGQKVEELRKAVRESGGVKMIFGSPSKGLFEMVGKDLGSRVDFVLNLFPQQQVETVRTEEAIFAGLALVSLISAGKA